VSTGGFRAVAVAPFDSAAIDPIAADATKRGVKIVSYITELEHQTAAAGRGAQPGSPGLSRYAADFRG
jgi:ABC-type sugar transport system substrate-binding protein